MKTVLKNLPQWMQDSVNDPVMKADILRSNEYEIVPYLVKDDMKHKVAIICPGGGYDMVCNFLEGEPYAKKLNAMGISAVVLYYRCRELAAYPAPQNDLARAVREVYEHAEEWNLDMEGYSVWGSSAGGHLAGSFGTENMGYVHYNLPKPGALVLIYPVITMGKESHEATRINLIGSDASEEKIRFTSVNQQVTSRYPATFLWCGGADATVSPENSHMLAYALEASGILYKFIQYEGVDHGVGLGAGMVCEGWFNCAVEFWLDAIKPKM